LILPLLHLTLNEPLYGPVKGLFHLIREKTGGQLLHLPVILYALATDALTAAGFIGAVALGQVLLRVTVSFFHPYSLGRSS
jgi:hypothetical protein